MSIVLFSFEKSYKYIDIHLIDEFGRRERENGRVFIERDSDRIEVLRWNHPDRANDAFQQ